MNLITAFKVEVKVVPNYVTENGGKSVLENVTESTDDNYLQLTERQRNIIDRLIETGKLRVSDNVLENALETSASLAKHLSVFERTIRRDLASLQSLGIIRRVGPDKGGHWEVIPQK